MNCHQIKIQSRECLFQGVDYSLQLLDEIAVLIDLCLYALNPSWWRPFHWFINNSGICLQKLCRFGWISEYRWISQMANNLQFNHTALAGTLLSTGHCWPTVQLLLCLSCAPDEETFCLLSKSHTNRAATINWPIKSNHWPFKLITDYLNNVEGEYRGIRRTLWNAAARNHVILRHSYHFLPEESDKLGCHVGIIQVTLSLTHHNS